MDLNYYVRHAQFEDSPRLEVLAAQVWLHTYAKEGVSSAVVDWSWSWQQG